MNPAARHGLPVWLLALVVLPACGSSGAHESGPTSRRIPLAGDLTGSLTVCPIDATRLLLIAQRDEPRESPDGVRVVDLERESVEERACQPVSHFPGFGASMCVSSDAQRVLIGVVPQLQSHEPGRVLAYRWPQLELEFEVRGESGGDWFGSCIAEIADVDGDSRPDFIVGAPCSAQENSKTGALVCVSGANGRILRRAEGMGLGRALAVCGDCDGDGVPDLAALGASGVELRSGRDLHVLRTLATSAGMFPVLIGGAGLALLEDDGGSWPYTSHKTVTAWSAGQFDQICRWKPERHALLYASAGSLGGARLVFLDGNQLASSDVLGRDVRELAPHERGSPRAACGLSSAGPTRWRTAVVLGLEGGRGNDLLLTTR